jgi:hypothetical protein
VNCAAPLQRFGRSYGLPWQSGAPVKPSVVALVADAPLRLDRDPVAEVAGSFRILRAENSTSVCQVDWRVEGLTTDPVLPAHFVGGALPSGTAFFAAGVLEVAASVLLSPGADPARESYGRVVLENPVNCEVAPGSPTLDLSIVSEPISGLDAVVSLDVPFSVLELDPSTPATGYALGPDYAANWTLQQANSAHSSITQEDDGVVIEAGTESDGDIFLFAKLSPPGAKWSLGCKYTWLDGLAGQPGGTFTRFGYVRGKGAGGIEADPNLWSAADAGDLQDTTMDANCTGVRASLNTRNTGLNAELLSNKIRMRSYDPDVPGTPEVSFDGDSNVFTFVDGIEYSLQIKREGSKMTYSKSAPGTLTQVVSFTGDEIGDIGTAWIFWGAVAGRKCRIRNLTLVELP